MKKTYLMTIIALILIVIAPIWKVKEPQSVWTKDDFQRDFDPLEEFLWLYLKQNMPIKRNPTKQIILPRETSNQYKSLFGHIKFGYYTKSGTIAGYVYEEDLPSILHNLKSNTITKEEYSKVISWLKTKVIISSSPQANPFIQMLKAVEANHVDSFKNSYSQRITEDTSQNDWSANIKEAQNNVEKLFGDPLDYTSFSFIFNEKSELLSISYKNQKPVSLRVINEDGIWKLDQR